MSVIATQEHLVQRVLEAIVDFGASRELLRPEATLEELEVDTLDLFELGQILKQEYGIVVDPDRFEDVETLGDAQALLAGYLT
jgi:acyl carrier protein